MSRTTIDRLIINSPYEEPARHWRYERETRTFDLAEGRRPAGYVVASADSRAFDDPGRPSHPIHREHASVVHGKAVRADQKIAHQRLRL